MLNFINKLRLDKIKEGGTGGAAAEPAVEPKVEPPATPDSKATAQEGNTDDFGYPVGEAEPAAGDKPAEPKAPEPKEKTKEGEKSEEPSTGYGIEEPKVDEPIVEEKKPDEKPPEPDELDKALDGLPKDESQKIKDFAQKHKLTPEVAKGYAELRKQELADAEKFHENAQKELTRKVQEQRQSWHQELKKDPNFGGDKFAHNLQRADKVLSEFMPGLKKELTDRKGMLPPYVMRDLAKLADHLYSTEKLVTGDPGERAEESKPNEALDFYNQGG